MKFEKNIKKLETFRLKVENLKSKEDTKIENLLKWRENLTIKSIVSSKLINFNEVKGWHSDSNGNIHHKSGQFFSLQGVRTKGAVSREIQTWDQPILSQRSLRKTIRHKTGKYYCQDRDPPSQYVRSS